MARAADREPRLDHAPSCEAALLAGQACLRAAGVESFRRDARLLLTAALGECEGGSFLSGDRPISPAALARFEALIERRRQREPVSRILGRREFWSLDLAISPATLDPRPDSETLIEAVLARLANPQRPRRVLDLGTGSGNLLLAAVSDLPGAWGLGVDRDPAALTTAAGNAAALRLAGRTAFLAGDWGDALAGDWDVILSNPPYVRSGDIAALAPEVARFEPVGALDGGHDGLDAYHRVLPAVARLLARDGLAAVELGAGQATQVTALARTAGLETLDCASDLGGIERCLLLTRPSADPKALAVQKK